MRKGLIFSVVAVLCFSLGAAKLTKRQSDIMNAMYKELKRSSEKLQVDDYEKPYFISYRLVEEDGYKILGKYGSVIESGDYKGASANVEVRIGDYKDDQTKGSSSWMYGRSTSYASLPYEEKINEFAFRNAFWIATDGAYKRALTEYHRKKSKNVYEKVDEDEKNRDAFSKEKKVIKYIKDKDIKADVKKWEKNVRELAEIFNKYKDILESNVSVNFVNSTEYFINTEGTRVIQSRQYVSLFISASSLADDGKSVEDYRSFNVKGLKDLPKMKELKKEIADLLATIENLKNAPLIDPVSCPALLMPEPASILFHEAIGHRLEGERQFSRRSGQTFKGKVGKQIMPEFISMSDDPTMKKFKDQTLIGNYKYDQEGVPAQKVSLVEKGILKNYLLSRTPVNGFEKSNGHGRAEGTRNPVARMGVTIVKSHKEYSYKELKKMLIEEVKRQKKEFGLIIQGSTGGSTNTSSYGEQSFRGAAKLVYKVYPDGKEELVRDAEIIGTPLAAIDKIIATGKDYEVFNGFCGAESGMVPVSTISPSVLLSNIEIQKKTKRKSRGPILPKPKYKKKKK